MAAAYRQANHDRAVFLRAVLESGLRRAGSGDTVARVEHPGEFAAEHVRAHLVWSRRRADTTFALAWDVHMRLPMLGDAMYAGYLDEPRAVAFSRWTEGLTDEQAAQICAHLLPVAADTLVGQLIEEIKRLAVAIDPDWAEKRYRQAVKGRRVVGARNDDGTANITGHDLPVDRAAAACDRIDTLAMCCKRAGDQRPIHHIRVDLFLGMLDGTYEHMDDEHIVAHVLVHPFTTSDEGDGHGNHAGHGREGDGGGDNGGDTGGNDETGGGNGGPRYGGDGSGQPSSGSTADADEAVGTAPRDQPQNPDRLDPVASHSGNDHSASTTRTGTHGRGWSVRELRAEASALLELDERPGEIVGWGFVPATTTRAVITTMLPAEWRWVICDADGRPLACGTTRRRPIHAAPPGRATGLAPVLRRDATVRGGIVELQLRVTDLDRLVRAAAYGPWAAVITDIVTQVHTNLPAFRSDDDFSSRDGGKPARGDPLGRPSSSSPNNPGTRTNGGRVSHNGTPDRSIRNDHTRNGHTGSGSDTHGGDAPGGDACDGGLSVGGFANETTGVDALRRVAGAGVRRAVQVRDRSCTHPACRMSATRTDQDHAVDVAQGGLTVASNLGCCCRHDHRLKHQGGWLVHKPTANTTVWVTPLGHHYTNRTRSVIPAMPKTRPRSTADIAADACLHSDMWRQLRNIPNKTLRCGCTGTCGCTPTMPPPRTVAAGGLRAQAKRPSKTQPSGLACETPPF